ncbi:MAG: NUDIX domain-containing protein, partial [Candidatus Eremiobacteraeota bacterium]|nr:NUDIX domain-containing protein [Candidatus Eremiobacteraeota bacterium]
PGKQQAFLIPVGGGVEFGELGQQAIVREVKEELGLDIEAVELLGTLENIFTFDGQPGHEIVFVYDARFCDPTLYHRQTFNGVESNGEPFRVYWQEIEALAAHSTPLYPDGLLSLLTS